MGREFDQLFDNWASTYDDTVIGHDDEYKEAFLHYENILNKTAKLAVGTVLEFGVGTGNLTKILIEHGHSVIGIEPSKEMRAIASQKVPGLILFDGDFLQFPLPDTKINSIVSTYAFHHLRDDEKTEAINLYSSILDRNDKIVFADTMFLSEKDKANAIQQAKNSHYYRLAHDLETEYYTTIPVLQNIFSINHFDVQFTKMNKFVWLLEAIKK